MIESPLMLQALPGQEVTQPLLLAALNVSKDCLFVTDRSYHILIANSAATKLLGLDIAAIAGTSLLDQCRLFREDLAEDHALPYHLLDEGLTYSAPGPISLRTTSGHTLSVELTVAPHDDLWIWAFRPLTVREEIKKQLVLQADLLDNISESVIAADLNANIVYWNRAAEKLYGWTAEEAVGRHVYELIIPVDQREAAFEGFKQWKDDLPRIGESLELRKDGSVFPSHTRLSVVKNSLGERIGFVGLSRDLAKEKEAQENLNYSLSLLHATLQSTIEGVLVVDSSGKITAWNEQFVRMWLIPPDVIASGSDEAALAVATQQLIDPEPFIAKVQQLYSEPEAESFDTIEFKDGRVFERSSKPQYVNSKPVGRVWSFRDVTSLYQTTAKLEDQKSLYESLLNIQSDMGEGLVIASSVKVYYVNEAVQEITGFSADELYAMNNILDTLHPDERKSLADRLARRMRGEGVPTHYETRLVHKSGRTIDIEIAVKRRSEPNQDQLVILLRDITSRKEIERSLRVSESRFRTVIDNLGEALVITDREDRIIYLNSKLEELSGYSASECLGKNGPELMTLPVEHEFNRERLQRRLSGKEDQYEVLLKGKSGSLRWCFVSAVPYYDIDGEIIGTVAAITDIHEQKQKALALQRAEERFRYVTLATRDAVYDWSLDTNSLWWNESFTTLFGHRIEAETTTLETWAALVHPEDHDRITRGLTAALAQGKQIWSDEYRFRRSDGTYAFVIDRGYIISDEHGHPYRMIGAMMDMTDRRRAEEELRMAAANTSALIENTSDAILSVDRELRLITFNSSYFNLFKAHNGHEPYPGMSLAYYFRSNESEYWDALFQRAFSGEHFTIERRRSTILLHERIFEMSFNPIFEGSEVVGVAIFDKDITERKHMEQQLIDAKERAEEMSRLKSSFLANMSHEIRTPMTAILGFASIIRENSESEDLHEYANTIERSGTRLLATINGILDLAKIEANKMELNLQALPAKAELEKAVKFFQPLARNKGLELVLNSSCDCTISADEQYLGQVLNNLIGNAIKFTSSGSVTVSASYSMTDGRCDISVTDTGVGISEEFLPYIFDEFKQESGGYDRSYEGSGLGLTISRRLCEMMNASIHAVSKLGSGTTFSVRFPIVEQSSLPQSTPVEIELQQAQKTIKHLPRVLLVEDANDTAKLVDLFVRGICDLEIADSAEAALTKTLNGNFDLVLMDINLGHGASGLDVTKALRSQSRYRSTPIIALTAYAMKGDRESAIAAGCSDYLSKPFSKDQLAEKLRAYLEM